MIFFLISSPHPFFFQKVRCSLLYSPLIKASEGHSKELYSTSIRSAVNYFFDMGAPTLHGNILFAEPGKPIKLTGEEEATIGLS
jgi:hypothetical protein